MRTRTPTFNETPELPFATALTPSPRSARKSISLANELIAFREFGKPTKVLVTSYTDSSKKTRHVSAMVNEFWTARQRQAHSLHEISYRACFKPQLPRFFIERLTKPGDVVYDPFMGRGTTPVETALLGRVPFGNDINPLSIVMTRPRLLPVWLKDVVARLNEIDLNAPDEQPADLLAFYHPKTLCAISSLKRYFRDRRRANEMDPIDEWIEMVSLNRLTGHSPGFFSVYTLPPNQAVSVKSQLKINAKRNQVPPERDVPQLIVKKSRQLLKDLTDAERKRLAAVAANARLHTRPAADTQEIADNSVQLVVTSPPFLNVVQYAQDNWLRCWFLSIDPSSVALTVPEDVDDWQREMAKVFRELFRVLKPGGHVAFEVGEVNGGDTKLEEYVLPAAAPAGFEPVLILINDQEFTKTANCWGVNNMSKGTNTNRVVVLRKP